MIQARKAKGELEFSKEISTEPVRLLQIEENTTQARRRLIREDIGMSELAKGAASPY